MRKFLFVFTEVLINTVIGVYLLALGLVIAAIALVFYFIPTYRTFLCGQIRRISSTLHHLATYPVENYYENNRD